MSRGSRFILAVVGTGLVVAGIGYGVRNLQGIGKVPEQMDLVTQFEEKGVPQIAGEDFRGRPFSLEILKGKIVILNFWASWCGPCAEEFPSFIQLIQKMKGRVVLVAISQDSDLRAARDFAAAFKLDTQDNIYLLSDLDRSWGKLYGVEKLPESFIANANLKLARKVIGSIPWHNDGAIDYFTRLLDSAN